MSLLLVRDESVAVGGGGWLQDAGLRRRRSLASEDTKIVVEGASIPHNNSLCK